MAQSKAIVLAVVAAPLVLIMSVILGVVSLASSATASTGCAATASQVNTGDLPTRPIAGYAGVQLVNAAAIMNAAAALGLPVQAEKIGVAVAMGESGLIVLDHGDAAGPDSRGLFQQRANGAWGSLSDRMDPTISATNFFTALEKVRGWQTMTLTEAAHAVQGNADANYYATYEQPADEVVAALSGVDLSQVSAASSTRCTVAGNPQQLAQTLADAWNRGTFRDTDHPQMVTREILPIANGTATPECQVDTRILQLLVAALNKYQTVTISDINRPCVGISTDCSTGSLHCTVPARAVDFNEVGGNQLTGSGNADTEFLHWLNMIMPKGSQVGQQECRPPISLGNLHQFNDTCDHQHVDLGSTTAPLALTDSTASQPR